MELLCIFSTLLLVTIENIIYITQITDVLAIYTTIYIIIFGENINKPLHLGFFFLWLFALQVLLFLTLYLAFTLNFISTNTCFTFYH